MSGRPAERPASDLFEKLISPELYIRASRGPHCRVDPFYKNLVQTDLTHLGVGLAGSACRVKGVTVSKWPDKQ